MVLLQVGLERSSVKLHVSSGVSHNGAIRKGATVGTLVATLISIAISLAASGFGFATARRYVRDRLKYVDAVHKVLEPA